MTTDIYGKSAKMWVHEICVKQMVQPKWDCKEIEPREIPPRFICICKISYTDKTLTAIGKTKKEAQQEAALLMLYKRLKMTPAKLDALNKASKAKSAESGGSCLTNGNNDDDQIDPVSDTDDSELLIAPEPVSELFALCNVNNLEEPVFAEIKNEGPTHKRIFTMSCSIPDKDVALTARRLKKQAAKKMSAYRALRELKKRGYEYIAFQPNDDDSDGGEQPVAEAMSSKSSPKEKVECSRTNKATLDAIAKHFNSLELVGAEAGKDGKPLSQRELLLKYCGKPICEDTSGNCMSLLVDFPHAFQHLKPSATMEETLTKSDLMQASNEHGGPLQLLQKIVTEMKIRTSFIHNEKPLADVDESKVDVDECEEVCIFLRMEFPFNFKYSIPNAAVVNGVGMTEVLAKDNAAFNGLKLLRSLFFEEEQILCS